MSIEITKNNFESEVLNSQVPVLVDFWASWCNPCKMMAPVVDELSQELNGKAKIVKINVDDEIDLASDYSIMSIPTFMVFKNGSPVKTLVGVRSKTEIENLLN